MNISRLSGNDLAIGKIRLTKTKRSISAGNKHVLFADMTRGIHGQKYIKPIPVVLKASLIASLDHVSIANAATPRDVIITVTGNSIKVIEK